jgi:tRNA 2-thiouridine synthesizing protein A
MCNIFREIAETSMADRTLDTRGLACPLPILKAKKAIGELPVGGTLEVLATDPGARDDFSVFCQTTGHVLVEDTLTDGVLRVVLRRSR